MSVTHTLFTRWMREKNLPSVRQACLELGVQPQAATYWKDGRNAEAHIIERMANDLNEQPAAWILAAAAEKVRAAEERRTLMRMAKLLGYAASLLCTTSLASIPTIGNLHIM